MAERAEVALQAATRLAAAFELGRRLHAARTRRPTRLRRPRDVARFFAATLAPLVDEEVWIAALDTHDGVRGARMVSRGGLLTASVRPAAAPPPPSRCRRPTTAPPEASPGHHAPVSAPSWHPLGQIRANPSIPATLLILLTALSPRAASPRRQCDTLYSSTNHAPLHFFLDASLHFMNKSTLARLAFQRNPALLPRTRVIS